MRRQYEELLAERIDWRRADKRSEQILAEEQALKEYYEPPNPTLTEFLAQTQEPTKWRIKDLHQVGTNCTITAQYKTGKSTTMLNLIHSLADGVPFLGEFPVIVPDGNIEYWNMELSDSLFRDWLRDTRTQNTDKIRITNLRGRRQPLYSKFVQDQVVERMKRNEIECWIIDPAARILSGWPGYPDPENSNACITEVTEILDEIKERAGILDLWIPLHTGREASARRARGATRWDDWTDVRFLIYIDGRIEPGVDTRVLKTDGRDTIRLERPMSYDEPTRTLRLETDIEGMKLAGAARSAVHALMAHPEGLATRELRAGMKGAANEIRGDAIKHAEERQWLIVEKVGRAEVRRLNMQNEEVQDMLFKFGGAK